MSFPLPMADLDELGINRAQINRLDAMIRHQIEEGRYPGCQIAIARNGRLGLFRSYGDACIAPQRTAAADETLWLLYSGTKVLTMVTFWTLVEEGRVSFTDRVADHVPEFAARGKRDITILQLATHQAGYPNAAVSKAAWSDHKLMRAEICDFALEWTPGSKVSYHPRSAHYTIAMLIEELTGQDYREAILSRLIRPLGLEGEIYVGLPKSEHGRAADMHFPPAPAGAPAPGVGENGVDYREAGIPSSGGFGTARGMAAFYQMMAQNGRLGSCRFISPRMVAYATKNRTGDRVDELFGMQMHRSLGPHVRGDTDTIRGLGAIAAPETFGQGGNGNSYCWADPASGVSFAYLTNLQAAEPWHSIRLDRISNIVHAAIDELPK